jgi:hypothetical protein
MDLACQLHEAPAHAWSTHLCGRKYQQISRTGEHGPDCHAVAVRS